MENNELEKRVDKLERELAELMIEVYRVKALERIKRNEEN